MKIKAKVVITENDAIKALKEDEYDLAILLLPSPGREDESPITKERGFRKLCSLLITKQRHTNKLQIGLKHKQKGKIDFYDYTAFILYQYETMKFLHHENNNSILFQIFPGIEIIDIGRYDYRYIDGYELGEVKYPDTMWRHHYGKLTGWCIYFKGGFKISFSSIEEWQEKLQKALSENKISTEEEKKALILFNKICKSSFGILKTKQDVEKEKKAIKDFHKMKDLNYIAKTMAVALKKANPDLNIAIIK